MSNFKLIRSLNVGKMQLARFDYRQIGKQTDIETGEIKIPC